MNILEEKLMEAKTVAITGHIHPDGDCVGACLGLYNYLKKYKPEITATVFLEIPSAKFSFMRGYEDIDNQCGLNDKYDLVIVLDCSDKERLGENEKLLFAAGDALCIDHHRTNTHYIEDTVLMAEGSSTCELLYTLLDKKFIDRYTAECIYTGIIHDTGVFKFQSTSSQTMRIAGELMDFGVDFGKIIDDTFFTKTYLQEQILGRALLESFRALEGKCIFTAITKKDMDFYGVDASSLDGIVDQLRVTQGVECAIFIYETGPQTFKASLRSNDYCDVSSIAGYFGGGGHYHAAGCTMNGSLHDIISNLLGKIEQQIKEHENDKRDT